MTVTRKLIASLSSFLLLIILPGIFADDQCQTIYEIVCENDGLENFCELIDAVDLQDLFGGNDFLTVFAPVNEAVTSMDFLTVADYEKLREVVLFHVHDGALYTDEMECEAGRNRLRMASGKDSRTICQKFEPTFQKGGGNSAENKPMMLEPNIEACNGVIHIMDAVLLPGGFEKYLEDNDGQSSTGTKALLSSWCTLALIFLVMNF